MKILVPALILIFPAVVTAQQPACNNAVTIQRTELTDAHAVLTRALGVVSRTGRGSAMFRRSVDQESFCSDSLSFITSWGASSRPELITPLPASASARSNSGYPRDRNDGAMWSGVGVNTQLGAGAQARWRFLRAALYPKIIYHENAVFDHPLSQRLGRSEFANPYIEGIDLPKRMGTESFSTADLGHSFIEAGYASFYAAFSNENLWLGPTQVHSLLLSNTAPGFPHVRFGTSRPVDLKWLNLEGHVLFGSVKESDFLFTEPQSHLFQATALFIEPKFLPGLHIGITRVLRDSTGATGHSIGYYIDRIIDSPFYDAGAAGIDASDRQSGVYARWVLPESGFEAYMEWGREDFPFSFLNAIIEPDYTQVWAAGLQKVYASDQRLTRVYAELLHLGQAAPIRAGRAFVRFYATRLPGFTNRGQMLGAGAGPGADAQTIGFDTFDRKSRTGVLIERVRYDEDTYYEQFSRRWSESRHDVELTGEFRRTQFVGPVTIEAALRYSHRWNRDFISALTESSDMSRESNIGTELSVSWTPRW